MSERGPDLDRLIGRDVPGRERERLARVHEALVQAGPPPGLPASLSPPPDLALRRVPVAPRARPRRRALLAAAAAAAILVLVGGSSAYLLVRGSEEGPRRVVAMRGTRAAPAARATVRVGARDAAGNWMLTLRVSGLPRATAGGYYEMYLTSRGRIVVGCGTFKTDPGTTVVRFNVPFRLTEYSGWVIRRERAGRPPGPTLLAT
jgi:hypothetical protein